MLSTCTYIWICTRVYAWWIWCHGDIPNLNDICNGKHTCSIIYFNLSTCAVLWCVCMAFDTMCISNKVFHPYIHNILYIMLCAHASPGHASIDACTQRAWPKLKSSNWLSKGYLMKSSQIRWKLGGIRWTSNANAIKSKGNICSMEVWIFWIRMQFGRRSDSVRMHLCFDNSAMMKARWATRNT